MNNSVKILTRAMEVLDERGWCQYGYVDHETGAVCSLEAVDLAIRECQGSDEERLAVGQALCNASFDEGNCQVGSVIAGSDFTAFHIVHFNDKVAESVEDVKLVFKKAIYKLEEEQ